MSFFHSLLYSSPLEAFTSFDSFIAKSPPEKYASNPIILHDATYTNISPGSSPITDPQDSTKLLMYVGEFKGNTSIEARIAVYRAAKTDLYTWTRVGTFLAQGADATNHDQNGVRFGNAVVYNGTVYYFYCGLQGTSGNGFQAVCLATSTDGVTATKQGVVFEPDLVNDFNFTDPFVYIENGVWYMHVTAKTASFPELGVVVATSNDGLTWTRTGNKTVQLGDSRGFDGKYIEGCCTFKVGSDYITLYTTCANSNIWSIAAAQGASMDETYTKESTTWFQHSLSGWDSGGVAVAFEFTFAGRWYLFYQGTAQSQPASVWDIGIAELLPDPDPFPAGYIAGKGDWTGQAFFDLVDQVTVGDTDRWVRALDNTGFATAYVEHPLDITADVTSNMKVTIRTDTATGAFRGGFYLYEGSNQVTGIYFNSGNISYLTSAGWTTLQAYSANTTYRIEIRVTSKTTFQVWVNDVQIVFGQTPFTVITTKVDKLRLEKAQASTAKVYFKNLIQTNIGVASTIDIGQ